MSGSAVLTHPACKVKHLKVAFDNVHVQRASENSSVRTSVAMPTLRLNVLKGITAIAAG